jgi:hypothetical protein
VVFNSRCPAKVISLFTITKTRVSGSGEPPEVKRRWKRTAGVGASGKDFRRKAKAAGSAQQSRNADEWAS